RVKEGASEQELPRLYKSHELFEKEPQAIASREDLFLSETELDRLLARPGKYFFETFVSPGAPSVTLASENVRLGIERETMKQDKHKPLEPFARKFRDWMDLGYRVGIVCHTHTHAEHIRSLFQPYEIPCAMQTEGVAVFPAALDGDF